MSNNFNQVGGQARQESRAPGSRSQGSRRTSGPPRLPYGANPERQELEALARSCGLPGIPPPDMSLPEYREYREARLTLEALRERESLSWQALTHARCMNEEHQKKRDAIEKVILKERDEKMREAEKIEENTAAEWKEVEEMEKKMMAEAGWTSKLTVEEEEEKLDKEILEWKARKMVEQEKLRKKKAEKFKTTFIFKLLNSSSVLL
uniref:Uncharacterized protein n=1 Tax=Caenorhabditis tropicalis TaxID=1561998 RepID=A0A1I7V3B5_9PELO